MSFPINLSLPFLQRYIGYPYVTIVSCVAMTIEKIYLVVSVFVYT
jgi:hypothetical protein